MKNGADFVQNLPKLSLRGGSSHVCGTSCPRSLPLVSQSSEQNHESNCLTFFMGSVTGKSQLRFEDDFDSNKIKVM